MVENMSLVEFYSGFLSSAKLTVQPDGAVLVDDGSGPRPLTISNAKLYLPTAELMKSANNLVGKIMFHPVWEGALRKESIIQKRVKAICLARLQYVIGALMEELMAIAAAPEKHSLLTPEQSNYLSLLPDANAKSVSSLRSVLNGCGLGASDGKLITINIRRAAVLPDKEYRRAAIVSFPITDDRSHNEKKLVNVTVTSKGAKEEILRLFDFILPNSQMTNHYSFGTDEMLAPNFVSVLGAYAKVANQLNAIVNHFRSILNEPYELMTDLSWFEAIGDIQRFRAAAPAFPGNEGDPQEGANETEAQAPVSQAAAIVASPAAQKAVQLQPIVAAPMKMSIAADLPEIATIATNQANPNADKFNAFPKWTDKAAAMVSNGILRPVSKVEDVLLNNPGATNVVVVDQNGRPVSTVDPNQAMHQAVQQQLHQQYYQQFLQYCAQMNIPVGTMTPEQQMPMFQMWLANSGVMNQQRPMMGNMPMMNTGFNQPVQNFGGFNSGFQQHNPFEIPGKVALRNQQNFGNLNTNNNSGYGNYTAPTMANGLRNW